LERWATTIREKESVWPDVFVYLKHEESGMGPRLAKQLMGMLGGTRV
jgi:predicted acetyltransferase